MPPKTNERAVASSNSNTHGLSGMEIIEVTSDVSTEGQFLELLESFYYRPCPSQYT